MKVVSRSVAHGNGKALGKVLLNFGEHGRELISPEVGVWFLKAMCDLMYLQHLIDTHGLPKHSKEILESLDMRIVPMENEHGREMVERGDLCERKNGRGVDPNRNWAVDWGKKEADYDPKEEFPGKEPFSEPEARLLRDLAAEYSPDVFITIHSGMEAMFVPYDHKNAIPYSDTVNATLRILTEINAKFCNGTCAVGSGGDKVGYLAHGTATDYMHEVLGIPVAMTWEIYGDFKASHEDCFKMFNPVERDAYDRIVDRWVATLIYFLVHVVDHPPIVAPPADDGMSKDHVDHSPSPGRTDQGQADKQATYESHGVIAARKALTGRNSAGYTFNSRFSLVFLVPVFALGCFMRRYRHCRSLTRLKKPKKNFISIS